MSKRPTPGAVTVDARLREFRVLTAGDVEYVPFDSARGKRILRRMQAHLANKFIGVWTIGMMQESSETREAVEQEFLRLANEKDDWLYVITVRGRKFFVAENGEYGYTAMRADEY